MIDVDFGESQDGSTLWFIINDREDVACLQQVVLRLSNGSLDDSDLLSDREKFRANTSRNSLVLAATADFEKGRIEITPDASGQSFCWKQPRLDWDMTLQKVDAMAIDSGHQYFDYPNITVVVSVGEGLKRTAK